MRILVALAAVLVAGTATAQPRPGPAFADATATHVPTASELHALDAVFGDFDKDGDLDVALAVEYGANRLYLNDGKGKLRWVEGALGRTVHDSEHVRTADFDGDGFLDLVFVAEDGANHQLFLGRTGGRFEEVSQRLPGKSEGNGLAVGDVNGDRLPDIVVGNSAEKGGVARNFLWLNDPKKPGHFIDASKNLPTPAGDEAQGVALGEPDEETQPVSDGEPVGVGVPDADAVEEREERPEGVDETEGVEDAQPDAERESAGEPLAEGEWLDVTDADGVREEVAL